MEDKTKLALEHGNKYEELCVSIVENKRSISKSCIECGKNFDPLDNWNRVSRCCSKICSDNLRRECLEKVVEGRSEGTRGNYDEQFL